MPIQGYNDRTSGFYVKAKYALDRRSILTKKEMKDSKFVDGTSFKLSLPAKTSTPPVAFTFCIDDKQFYYYHADNADTAETGKWAKLELGSGAPTANSGPVSERPDPSTGKPGDKWYDPETGKTYIIVADSEGNQSWVETTPEAGEMMYDATTGKILYFDGTEWKEVGGLSDTTSGTTAPSPAKKGDLWLDTNQNPPVLKVYDGTQWKVAPVKEGEMMYDDTNNQILYYDGTQWKPIGGGVDKVETLPSNPEEGKIYYDSEGNYKVFENGTWFSLCKVWEGTEAQYTTLGGDAFSQANPDVVFYITN